MVYHPKRQLFSLNNVTRRILIRFGGSVVAEYIIF